MIVYSSEKPRVYVVGARSYADAQNLRRHARDLGMPAATGTGAWNGARESCVAIVTSDACGVHVLARLHEQVSYLAVSENDRQAYEVNTATGYHRAMGRLRALDVMERNDVIGWVCLDGVSFVADGRNLGVDLPEGF